MSGRAPANMADACSTADRSTACDRWRPPTPPVTCSQTDAASQGRAYACGVAQAQRHHTQQSARGRRRFSPRRVHGHHRRIRLGQIQSREPGTGGIAVGADRTGVGTARGGSRRRGERGAGFKSLAAHGRTHHRRSRAHQAAVTIDQKPIGRTPRSNLATYTGLFDHVRRLFASTPAARKHHFDAGRFSFNVAKGRCATCEGEGAVSVELLFMPSVYAPCPTCKGARYNDATLKVRYRDKNIADVLGLTVGQACEFFADEAAVMRPLRLLSDIGLEYLGWPGRHRSVGRRGTAHQTCHGAAARAARQHALCDRRADHRPASG